MSIRNTVHCSRNVARQAACSSMLFHLCLSLQHAFYLGGRKEEGQCPVFPTGMDGHPNHHSLWSQLSAISCKHVGGHSHDSLLSSETPFLLSSTRPWAWTSFGRTLRPFYVGMRLTYKARISYCLGGCVQYWWCRFPFKWFCFLVHSLGFLIFFSLFCSLIVCHRDPLLGRLVFNSTQKNKMHCLKLFKIFTNYFKRV